MILVCSDTYEMRSFFMAKRIFLLFGVSLKMKAFCQMNWFSIVPLLTLKKEVFKKDRPFWRMNNSLLKDFEYVKKIKKIILEVKQRYMVPVYNMDVVKDVSSVELQFVISDRLFF